MATDRFTSKTSGQSYCMRCSTTCKTTNLIQCQKCGCQYVGETEHTLNERMNSHRTDIRHKRTKKPVLHVNSWDHILEDVRVMVIERIWRNDTVIRKIRENRWIATLSTSWPKGMLIACDYLLVACAFFSQLHTFLHHVSVAIVCTCVCIYSLIFSAFVRLQKATSRNAVCYIAVKISLEKNIIQTPMQLIYSPINSTNRVLTSYRCITSESWDITWNGRTIPSYDRILGSYNYI